MSIPSKRQSAAKSHFTPPLAVRRDAKIGLRLHNAGFQGGTPTGWNRAKQLAESDKISLETLAAMRAWYARHGPDAANGGTSYPGYLKWLKNSAPMKPNGSNSSDYRGAVAWLIWGGDAAYEWLKTNSVRRALEAAYPKRKVASTVNNLARNKRQRLL